MSNIFHLSFWVDDLQKSKQFYSNIFGCAVGRQKETWCDIDFFGHQVTIHQAREPQVAIHGVGPSRRSLDHFGVILAKEPWQALLKKLEAEDVEFRVRPKLDNPGQSDEMGKFVVTDPDGIGLEFKYSMAMDQPLERAGRTQGSA